MIKAKIVRTGNSKAIIIPSAILESKDLDVGDEVEIEEMTSGLFVRRSPPKSYRRSAERVIRRNRRIFAELAKR